MTLKIRPMYDADLDSVYAIETSVHISPWSKDIIRDCILVGYDCRVVEYKKEQVTKIIGYIISRYHNKSYHILNFCIDKSMQSQGIGKQFLRTVLESLPSNKNLDYAILEVRPSNVVALKLYAGIGFEPIDSKKDYYKDSNSKEDAVVLKKILNGAVNKFSL